MNVKELSLCHNYIMQIIVTHCDQYFVTRVCALIDSLQIDELCPKILVFAHDEVALEQLTKYLRDRVEVLHYHQLLEAFPELQAAQVGRSRIQFLFALTPFMLKFALNKRKASHVYYIDGDICFFERFSNIQKELGEVDIAITPHNFDLNLRYLEKYGLYNVGLVYARNSAESLEIIKWWANRCLESTDTIEGTGIYGDQKYLDEFTNLDGKVLRFSQLGFNAAPWNTTDVTKSQSGLKLSDSSTLYFYHYSGLRRYKNYTFLGYSTYYKRPSKNVKNYIYKPYLDELIRIAEAINFKEIPDTRTLKLRKFILMLSKKDFVINSKR